MQAPPEFVSFSRECEAIQVPDGIRVTISEGTEGRITQALGTSFTVVTQYGQMFRIDGKDADAIGKEPIESAELADANGSLEDRIWAQLATCYDPEIPINIVELGLVYHCRVTSSNGDEAAQRVEVKMTLTAPGCGMGDVLRQEVKDKVETLDGVGEVDVEIVFEPPWDQSMMSEAARLQTGLM